MKPVVLSATDQTVHVKIIDSADGTPETGVVDATSGFQMWYRKGALGSKTNVNTSDLATLGTAHADGGWLHVGDGLYRFDLPDAAVPTSENEETLVGGTCTGMIVLGMSLVGRATPGSAADLATLTAYVDTEVAAILAVVDTEVAAIKAKTDLIPTDPAETSDIPTAAAIADAVWDEVMSTSVHNTTDSAGQRLRRTSAVATDGSVNDAAATTTSFVIGGAVTVDDFYNDQVLVFTSGALIGQSKPVLDYVGSTKTITLSEALTSAPANGAEFILHPTHVHPIAQIADGVWDEALAGHAGAGSTGEALSAAGSAGDPWSTTLPGAYGAGTAGKIIGDNMNAPVGDVPTNAELATALATADDAVLAAVATVQADTDNIQTRLPAALVGGRMDADVAVIQPNAVSASALAADAVDEILDEPVEGAVTLRQALRLALSFIGAKVSGGGTTTITYRDIGDTKARITQTVDASGDRSAVTLDGS